MWGSTECVCKNCGCTFWVSPYKVRDGGGKFCSRKCSGEWRSQNWSKQGGKSFEPYPPAFNEAFKQKIRERDNYTCSICGSHWEEGNPAYPIHHVNYVKDDTVPENCITLCHSCHSKTNTSRHYWQKRLTGIVWAARAEQATLSMNYLTN